MHFTLQLHFLEVLMLAAVRITAFLMLAPPFPTTRSRCASRACSAWPWP